MSRMGEGPLPDPLGYFLTWPTYGTWLPGDERGWVRYRHGFQQPDPMKKMEAAARMTDNACRLDAAQRRLVESTIADHCRIRGWHLHAVNCRSNHLHVVVTSRVGPEVVRDQFKAWCTRRLKELEHRRGKSAIRANWWVARGSARYLNDLQNLADAIDYVRDAQDKRC